MKRLPEVSRLACVLWSLFLVAGVSVGARAKPAPTTDRGTAETVQASPAAFPDTLPGRRAAAYLKAFNSGDDEVMRAYEAENRAASALKKRSMEDRIELYHKLKSEWGTLKVGEVIASDERSLSAIVYADGADEWLEFGFELEPEPPHGLVAIMIKGPIPAPREGGAAVALDAAARSEVVDEIAKALEASYVYPDVGKNMAEAIRKSAAGAEYGDITRAHALASRLTRDLRDICHDRHLTVSVEGGGCCQDAPQDEPMWAKGQWHNFGFEKVERLAGNVGYLKFNQFNPAEEAKEVAAAAMNFLANCDAVIFDLRENGGGSPEMIAFLSSYLFNEPVHLNSFYNRREDKTTETWTQAEVPGRRFGQDKPAYVLTSGYTFSGAEEFTYNFKNLKRATIVGETTGGGAHPIFRHRINDSFSINVPYARAINPITKTNWEGTGVEPDVKVPAGRALLVAHKAALEQIIKTAANSEQEKALRSALRHVEGELSATGGGAVQQNTE